MFWKDALAHDILEHDVTIEWLHSIQRRYPSLRVKTIDAKGKTPVIQLAERGEWIKPKEWASNHLSSLTQRYLESQSRLKAVGSNPSNYCSDSCPVVSELKNLLQSDPTDVERLRKAYDNVYMTLNKVIDCIDKHLNDDGSVLIVPGELQSYICKYRKAQKLVPWG